MRSALRWIARLGLSVLVLACAALGVAALIAHTGWGREQLRQGVETELRHAFPGGARVGRIEGSIFGALTVYDVVLSGRDRQPLLAIGALRARVALWSLVSSTLRFDELVADDVRVHAHPQPPAAAVSVDAAGSSWRIELPCVAIHRATVEIATGGTMQTIAGLDVTGSIRADAGRVVIAGWAHGTWQDRAVELTATGEVVVADTVQVPAALVTLGDAAILATRLTIDPERPEGSAVVRVPVRSLIQLVPPLADALADQPGDMTANIDVAQVAATAATTAIAAVAPTARAAPIARAASTQLELTATAGGAVVSASLRGEPAQRTIRGVISATAADLGAVTGGRVQGRAGVLAALDGSAAGVRGTLVVHYDAPVSGNETKETPSPFDAIIGIERAGDDRLDAFVFASGSGNVHAFATARVQRNARGVVLEDARVAVNASRVVVGGRWVTGALAGFARARGSVTPALDIEVTGGATGSRVESSAAKIGGAGTLPALPVGRGAKSPVGSSAPGAAGSRFAAEKSAVVAIARADGSFRARVGSDVRLESARVTAAEVRQDGNRIGDIVVRVTGGGGGGYGVHATLRPPAAGVEILAEGTATQSATSTTARLSRTQITLPNGTIWAGDQGSIAMTDRAIAIRGVTLSSGDARIALVGDLERRTGALTAQVEAEGLAVSAIDPGYRGRGSARLALGYRGGHWRADGRLAVSGLAVIAGAPPVDGAAHVVLADRRATLDAALSREGLGGVDLGLEVDLPRDLFDPHAWLRIDRDAVHNATITARGVELAGIAAVAGLADSVSSTPLTGTLDGTIDLAPTALRGELALRGVELPVGAPGGASERTPGGTPVGTIDIDLALAPLDGDLTAHISAVLAGVATGDARVRLAVPRHPFDPETWRRRGRDLVREATADLDDVAFDPALLDALGVGKLLAGHGGAPYRGLARIALALDAEATQARLAIDLDGVTGGLLVEPVSQRVSITAGPAGTHLDARWFAPARRGVDLALGSLEADVPMTTDRWLVEPGAALQVPLTAQWTLPAIQARPLLAIVGRDEIAGGTVEGSAAITGTLAAPLVPHARLVARDIDVAPRLGGGPRRALTELEAVASWDGVGGSVAISGREAGGGTLRATVSRRPGNGAPAELSGSIAATRFDIAPLAAVVPYALVPTAGIMDADLVLERDEPGRDGRISGTLRLTGGALPIAPSVGTLRDVTVDLALDAPGSAGGAAGRGASPAGSLTATIDGKLGRGTVHLVGTAATDGSLIEVRELTLKDVSTLGSLRPVISGKVAARLHLDGAQLRGDVTVRNAHIAVTGQAATPLLDPNAPADFVFASAAQLAAWDLPALRRPWLDAVVVLGPTRIVAHDVIDNLGLDADAIVHSDRLALSIGEGVGVTGTIAIDGNYVDLLGRRYALEPGELELDGTADPRLAIHLARETSGLTLRIGLFGRASHPVPQLSSDPGGYTEDQLLAFVLGGEPGGDPGTQPGEAVRGALAVGISARLGRRLSRVLPFKLDVLSCELATTTTSASCSAGGWLTPQMFFGLRKHLDPLADENTTDWQVQYRLGRKSFELTLGDREHYSGDLLWRLRW